MTVFERFALTAIALTAFALATVVMRVGGWLWPTGDNT